MEKRLIPSPLPGFTKYHYIMEKHLQEYPDEFLNDELKKYPNNLDSDLESSIYSEYSYISEVFPNILRYSFLITCYSYLETALIQECKIEKNIKSLHLDINDLKGKGIEQARNYLIKVAGIDFPSNEIWSEIMNFKDIRNFIVHNEGILNKSKKAEKIRGYIGRRQDIFIDGDKIILSSDYCKHVINIIAEFFQNLYNPCLMVPC